MTKYRNRLSSHGTAMVSYGVLAAALFLGAGCEGALADPIEHEAPSETTPLTISGESVVDWNTTASKAALLADQKYEDPFPHLRALTMMHLAIHDAVNAVRPQYAAYALTQQDASADPVVAAAAAAHGVLSSIYPKQRSMLDATLKQATAKAAGTAKDRGLSLGKAAAKAVMTARGNDKSDKDETYTPKDGPGNHRFVPPFDLVYRPGWRRVEPFALQAVDQYRSEPPPALESTRYATDYEEVKTYGRANHSTRTPDQTFYADWWYELSEIGWNRIARVTWAEQEQQGLWFTARLFALLNIGLMDAYIAGWDSKLHYDFWRPYTAIREGDTDNNSATLEEEAWEAYCVTPPVQDYPSTHAALGASAAAILRESYGRDVPFAMESTSTKPPGQKRSVFSFEQAAVENADSRVACGIHFRFATQAGLDLGRQVGNHVLASALLPKPRSR